MAWLSLGRGAGNVVSQPGKQRSGDFGFPGIKFLGSNGRITLAQTLFVAVSIG